MNNYSIEMIELELAILIRRSTSITANKKNATLDRSAYLILRRVDSNGAVGVKALAGEFHLDISTVSRQTSSLEQKGYLYRIPDPEDGRAYNLDITDSGKKELKEHKKARLERVMEIVEDWDEEEKKVFGKLLKKFNQSFY